MSITEELRKWAEDNTLQDMVLTTYPPQHAVHGVLETLLRIADRIDAEHQKALDEWKAEHGQMWLKGYSECHAELLEGNETLASDLERCGWVRLPKDADGEYIHIGDVVYDCNESPSEKFSVAIMELCKWGWSLIDNYGERNEPGQCRHHHAPIVEDVLREFFSRYVTTKPKEEDDAIIAEYAAKLKLAEGKDA